MPSFCEHFFALFSVYFPSNVFSLIWPTQKCAENNGLNNFLTAFATKFETRETTIYYSRISGNLKNPNFWISESGFVTVLFLLVTCESNTVFVEYGRDSLELQSLPNAPIAKNLISIRTTNNFSLQKENRIHFQLKKKKNRKTGSCFYLEISDFNNSRGNEKGV